MSIRERRRRRRRRENKQANENTNIHYEYTHDKWCTVAYLKKHVEKKVNDSTKQQQTQNRDIESAHVRERESVWRLQCSSVIHHLHSIYKWMLSRFLSLLVEQLEKRECRRVITWVWNSPMVVTLIRGFCFRRNTLRCFSTLTNALLRLKKTFWHSRIRSLRWTIRSSPARLLSRMPFGD